MERSPASDLSALKPKTFKHGHRRHSPRYVAVAVLVVVAMAVWTPAIRTWLDELAWWRQFGRLTMLLLASGCFGLAAWRRPLPLAAVGAAALLVFSWGGGVFAPALILAVGGLVAVGVWAYRACDEALPRKYRERRGRLSHVRAELRKARLGMERLAERAHMLEPDVVEREVAQHLEERKHAEVMSRLRRESVIWPSDPAGPDGERLRFVVDHFPDALGLAHGHYLEWQAHPDVVPMLASGASPDAGAQDREATMRLLEPIAAQWQQRIDNVRQEIEAQFDADHVIEQGLRSQWSAGRDVIAAAREKEARHTRELKLEEEELLAAERQDPAPARWRLVLTWLVAQRRLHPVAAAEARKA